MRQRALTSVLAVALSVVAIAYTAGAFTASEKATINALRDRISALEAQATNFDARLDTLEAAPTPTPTPTAAPTPTPTPAGNVVNIPASIDRTGATDVTVALRSFIASVPNGSTIVFPANAMYDMASGGIRLNGRQGLTFLGNGTTIKTTGCRYNDAPFLIEGGPTPSVGIRIDGFVLVGGNTAAGTSGAHGTCHEDASAVAIFASTDITVTNIRTRNIYADCLYASEASAGLSKRITFTDSVCELQGRMGVAIVGAEDVTVQRVIFDQIALYPFDIEPNGASGDVIRNSYTDNTIGRFGIDPDLTKRLFSLNGADDGSATVSDITFARNRVNGSPLTIVSDDPGRALIRIVDNISDTRVAGPVMTFRDCAGLTITGNIQPLSSGALASISGCTNVVDTGNVTS